MTRSPMEPERTEMKPEDLKQGDRVRVTFEAEVQRDAQSAWLKVVYGPEAHQSFTFYAPADASIELLPPEAKALEVGEEVTWGNGNFAHTVLCVDGGVAFVSEKGRFLNGSTSGEYITNITEDRLHRLRDLRRPDGRPIKVG